MKTTQEIAKYIEQELRLARRAKRMATKYASALAVDYWTGYIRALVGVKRLLSNVK